MPHETRAYLDICDPYIIITRRDCTELRVPPKAREAAHLLDDIILLLELCTFVSSTCSMK